MGWSEQTVSVRGSAGSPRPTHLAVAGFTLTELLVVIAIIGAVAAISIPALKGIGQSQTITNGARQLLEDIALARQYAILNRSTVHVLFVPPAVTNVNMGDDPLANRLEMGGYTTYAIYADRTIGDQPGQSRPRYLSKWKKLPDGVIVAPWEFEPMLPAARAALDPWDRPLEFQAGFEFPHLGVKYDDPMPRITFNADGSLPRVYEAGAERPNDEYVHLARGSVLAARDNGGTLIEFSVRESPPGNSRDNYYRIRIDGLTGRPALERPEIQ